MSKQINIAGKFHYYDRNEKRVSTSRSTIHNGPIYVDESEFLRDLAAAIDHLESMQQAVADMRELAKKAL